MRTWVFRIALLVASALILALVARNGAVQTFNAADAALPIKPIPDDAAQRLLRSGLLQVDLLTADIDQSKASAALKAADHIDPLDFRPFLVAGLIARRSGNLERAAALLEAARHRQPRNFNTRRVLMEVYLLDQNYEKAAEEILASISVSANDPQPLLRALAFLGADGDARKALVRTFAKRSDWRRRFMTSNAVISVAPDMVFEIATDKATSASERRAAVRALVQGQKIPMAYRLWTSSPPYPGFVKNQFPVDPGFDGLGQASGFGWKLINSSDGVAELVENNGKGKLLDVEFFGGNAATLIEQPLLLAPGRYKLSTTGRSIAGREDAGFYRWTIACLGDKNPVGVLRVNSTESSQFNEAAEFAVPAKGCEVQMLQMTIIPGELGRSMRANFTNIGISAQ